MADPTRSTARTVTLRGVPVTRQAGAKHQALLHDAGLVRYRKQGRERLQELNPLPLREVDDWLRL